MSICIPAYNCEKYIAAALDSAINQTLKDIEIVCVDDGSTDGTAAIMSSYAAKDPRIHVVSNGVNCGALYSRLRSILESTGDYVLCLDADDELCDDIARLAYERAIKTGGEIIVFDAEMCNRNGTKTGTWSGVNLRLKEGSGARNIGELVKLLAHNKHCWVPCWGRLYLASNLKKMAPSILQFAKETKLSLTEDCVFTWYALKNSASFAALDAVGYRYRTDN